jgi:hypothetical protein
MKNKNEPSISVRKKTGKNVSKMDSVYSKSTPSDGVYGFTSKRENTKRGTSKFYESKSVDSLDQSNSFKFGTSYPYYTSESVTKKKETPKKSSVFFVSKTNDSKRGASSDSSYSKDVRKPTERRSGKETELVFKRKNDKTIGSLSKTVKKLPKLPSKKK